ncbi:hypothetical protein ACX80V_14075 [Arthrobacter sp. MDT3-24]
MTSHVIQPMTAAMPDVEHVLAVRGTGGYRRLPAIQDPRPRGLAAGHPAGVGGSFVLAGHPVLGHRYAGGHVGHFASPYAFHEGQAIRCVCGGAGHVEAIASGPPSTRRTCGSAARNRRWTPAVSLPSPATAMP